MFISENICTMVDLFDKAVAEGVGGEIITVETKWEGDDETQKYRLNRDIFSPLKKYLATLAFLTGSYCLEKFMGDLFFLLIILYVV